MNVRPLIRSPLLWLGVILIAPFASLLMLPGGRVLGSETGDNPAIFYYFNDFAGRCWRQGTVPLWNPHLMLGLPFLGEGQAAIFHPLSWLFIALPAGAAINWLVALIFLFSGLFMYGWLRALRLGVAAAFCGALVWCYSNVLAARVYAGHLNILLVLVEIPLLLLLWERWRESPRVKYLIGIALAYGLMIAAAHPQVLHTFSLFFLIYVLTEAALACTSVGAALRQARAIGLLGVFIGLGTALGAVQLLPSADFVAESFRQKASIEFSGVFSFLPENLLTIVAPRFFGFGDRPDIPHYWNLGNYWEHSVYIGMLPLVLVAPGIVAAPLRRRAPLVICGAVFLVFALGLFTPYFPLIYKYVPFFKLFRGPAKNIVVTELCLIAFAAHGLDGLLQELRDGRRRLLGIALISAAALLLIVIGLHRYCIPGALAPDSNWFRLTQHSLAAGPPPSAAELQIRVAWAGRELLRAGIILAAGLAVLAGAWFSRRRLVLALLVPVAAGDMLGIFLPLLQTYPETSTLLPEAIAGPLRGAPYPTRVLVPRRQVTNIVMHNGLASASGLTCNTMARYNRFANAVRGEAPDTSQLEDPLSFYSPEMRFMAIEALIAPVPAFGPELQGRIAAQADGLAMMRIPDPCPRAWLAAVPVVVAGEAEALDYVMNPTHDVRRAPAIEHAADGVRAGPLGPEEQAAITAFSPNRVELEVAAARPRVLVLAEMYERNWTATVGDAPAEVFPADCLLRGVIVPAGRSRVVFEYRPAAVRWGAAITLFALTALGGIGMAARRAGNRPAPMPIATGHPRPSRKKTKRPRATPPGDASHS